MAINHTKNLTAEEWQMFVDSLNNGWARFYDLETVTCYLGQFDHTISMLAIARKLKEYPIFNNHKEDFAQRKAIGETSEEYSRQLQQIVKERNATCEISGKTKEYFRKLDEKIFGLVRETTFNWDWNVHHCSEDMDYEDLENNKDKVLLMNRAIHMTHHALPNLLPEIPALENNFDLQYEIGSFVHNRNRLHHWDLYKKASDNIASGDSNMYALKVKTNQCKGDTFLFYGKRRAGSRCSFDAKDILVYDLNDKKDLAILKKDFFVFENSGYNKKDGVEIAKLSSNLKLDKAYKLEDFLKLPIAN